jgi:nicotinamidase-related amidase
MPDSERRRALLVIDVQNEYFAGGALPVTDPPGTLPRILEAMGAAAAAGVPVVVIRHTEPPGEGAFEFGTAGWELRPEIVERPYDHLVDKRVPGSCTDTDLESFLRSRDVDTVAIAGYMTQMCCDTTARQASHLGLKVEFLSDATGTLGVENEAGRIDGATLHKAILVTQQSGFARVLPGRDWMDEVARGR